MLRTWIDRAQLNLSKVAEATGVTPAAVSYWSTGSRRIDRKYVSRLVAVLQIPDDELEGFLADIGHPISDLRADGAALLDLVERCASPGPPPVDPIQAEAA